MGGGRGGSTLRCGAVRFSFFFFFFSYLVIYIFFLKSKARAAPGWRAAVARRAHSGGTFPLTVGGTERPVRHEKWSTLISARSRLVKGISVEGTSHIGQIKESLSTPQPQGLGVGVFADRRSEYTERGEAARPSSPLVPSHPIPACPHLFGVDWAESGVSKCPGNVDKMVWARVATCAWGRSSWFPPPPRGVKKKGLRLSLPGWGCY